MLAAIFPDQFRAFLLKAVTPKNGHKGLSDEARAAELTRVDVELQKLEAQEEALVREMEAGTATPVPRRPDASPDILLAPTNELQS